MRQEELLGAVSQAGGNSGLDHGSGSGEGREEVVHIYLRDKINKTCLFTHTKKCVPLLSGPSISNRRLLKLEHHSCCL